MSLGDDHDKLQLAALQHYRKMVKRVEKFNCLKSLVIIKINLDHNRKRDRFNFIFDGRKLGYHIFPFLIDLIIRYGNSVDSAPAIDNENLSWLIREYNSYPDILHYDTGKDNINKYVPEYLMRSVFEQFPAQEMDRTFVPRILYTYIEIPDGNPDKHKGFLDARDSVVNNYFQVSIEDLLLCSVLIATQSAMCDLLPEEPNIQIEVWKHHNTSDTMRRVHSLLTISLEQYRSESEKITLSNASIAKYLPPLFWQYPIICVDTSQVVPDWYAILANVTRRLHQHFYRFHIEQSGHPKVFTTAYGPVFEEYIGLLLKMSMPKCDLINLNSIDGIKGRFADWLLIAGHDALIVECKATRMSEELKTTGSQEAFEAILSIKFQPAIEQLEATETYLLNNCKSITPLNSVERFWKYIVIEDSFDLLNDLQKFLPESNIASLLQSSQIQLASSLDIEIVVESSKRGNFKEVFIDKFSAQSQKLSLENHVRQLPRFSFTKNSPLDKKFDEFFNFD